MRVFHCNFLKNTKWNLVLGNCKFSPSYHLVLRTKVNFFPCRNTSTRWWQIPFAHSVIQFCGWRFTTGYQYTSTITLEYRNQTRWLNKKHPNRRSKKRVFTMHRTILKWKCMKINFSNFKILFHALCINFKTFTAPFALFSYGVVYPIKVKKSAEPSNQEHLQWKIHNRLCVWTFV